MVVKGKKSRLKSNEKIEVKMFTEKERKD